MRPLAEHFKNGSLLRRPLKDKKYGEAIFAYFCLPVLWFAGESWRGNGEAGEAMPETTK